MLRRDAVGDIHYVRLNRRTNGRNNAAFQLLERRPVSWSATERSVTMPPTEFSNHLALPPASRSLPVWAAEHRRHKLDDKQHKCMGTLVMGSPLPCGRRGPHAVLVGRRHCPRGQATFSGAPSSIEVMPKGIPKPSSGRLDVGFSE